MDTAVLEMVRPRGRFARPPRDCARKKRSRRRSRKTRAPFSALPDCRVPSLTHRTPVRSFALADAQREDFRADQEHGRRAGRGRNRAVALGRLRRASDPARHPGPQPGGWRVSRKGVHVQGEVREDERDAGESLRGPGELRQHRREQRGELAARPRALLRDDARFLRRRGRDDERSSRLGRLRGHGDGHHAPPRRVALGEALDAPEERAASESGRILGQRRRQRRRQQSRAGRRRRRRLAIGIRVGF